MTIELWALFGAALILFLSTFIQQIAIDRAYGAKYAISNREELPSSPSLLVERLSRLVRNHVEGLALFGSLVVIASVAEISNGLTQAAAISIVIARLLHFVFYAVGVTFFRSLAWGAGYLVATPVFMYGIISDLI